ncbi:hypothetical protein BSUW23_11710 [Bacillus spizizenii str. W23]|nr:hypothetical protein BSUW23_11710 [Bacillus spizizenii str. W23]EFG90569.1 hypothetical protein BSU6633_20377 [Bacillus spizizenii ATCC 6633 = JCM 2499]
MFQLFVFIVFTAVIFAAVTSFKYARIEKRSWITLRKSLTAYPKITINRLGQPALP